MSRRNGTLSDRSGQVVLPLADAGWLAPLLDGGANFGRGPIENGPEIAARGFEPEPDSEMRPVDEFLAHAALEAGEGQADAWEDCVQLMTMHSAKGLEFPLVFLSGMEDGLFPHQRSIADPNGLEEERRLAHVGLTRARKNAKITFAQNRRIEGGEGDGRAAVHGDHAGAVEVEPQRPIVVLEVEIDDDSAGVVLAALDQLELRLADNRYLLGDRLTEADWRLFTTLLRFDPVYVGHFKCNLRRLIDYPNLWGYTRELYQVPGVADTVHLDHIKTHYFGSHETINPTGIIPAGPEVDFDEPHGRDGVV